MLVEIYGAGWLDAGGPIRTWRRRYELRHVPGGAPGGGYDLCAGLGDLDAAVREVDSARARFEALSADMAAVAAAEPRSMTAGPLDEATLDALLVSSPIGRHTVGRIGERTLVITIDPFWWNVSLADPGVLGKCIARDTSGAGAVLAEWLADLGALCEQMLTTAAHRLGAAERDLVAAKRNRWLADGGAMAH